MLVDIVDRRMTSLLGREARLASFFFLLFFPVLHHLEPNRAMVGVGVGGLPVTVSCQLVPQRKLVVFCNYEITIKDANVDGAWEEDRTPSPPLLPAQGAGVGFCPDLVALFFFFWACETKPAAVQTPTAGPAAASF